MSNISLCIQQKLSRRQLLNQLDLPNDWSVIQTSFNKQDLSGEQQHAIMKIIHEAIHPEIRKERTHKRASVDELTIENPLEQAQDLIGGGTTEMTFRLRRKDLPTKEWQRERAAEAIEEFLAVFPEDQIQIRTEDDDGCMEKVK